MTIQSCFTDAAGTRFHYWQAGTGEPLILLHGFPQTAWEWRGIMPQLAESHSVFAPDTRGFGGTDKNRIRITMDFLARDTVDFMDSLGIERASLVGHDFGGNIAAAAVLAYPDRFDRVTIIDSSASVWIPWGTHGYWFKVEGLAEEFFEQHHRAFIDAMFAGAEPAFPTMPAGPFQPLPRMPNEWCDEQSLSHYRKAFADPDCQWHAIDYYRHGLPLHRKIDDHYELISNTEIREMWHYPEGFFAYPTFGEFHVYAPEHLHKQFDKPAQYVYTPSMAPQAFANGLPNEFPVAGSPALQAFVDHFPQLMTVPVLASHFLPEAEPELMVKLLRNWIRN